VTQQDRLVCLEVEYTATRRVAVQVPAALAGQVQARTMPIPAARLRGDSLSDEAALLALYEQAIDGGSVLGEDYTINEVVKSFAVAAVLRFAGATWERQPPAPEIFAARFIACDGLCRECIKPGDVYYLSKEGRPGRIPAACRSLPGATYEWMCVNCALTAAGRECGGQVLRLWRDPATSWP
jgi:hypothetical protein